MSNNEGDLGFLVEWGRALGLGHMFRCLALADGLRRQARCWLMPSSESYEWLPAELLERSLLPIAGRPSEAAFLESTLLAIERSGVSAVVVDYATVEPEYLRRLRVALPMLRVIAFDDVGMPADVADVIIRPNLSDGVTGQRGPVVYSGLAYCVLRPEFDAVLADSRRRDRARVERLCVLSGGAGSGDRLVQVLRLLIHEYPTLQIDAVCGPAMEGIARVLELVGGGDTIALDTRVRRGNLTIHIAPRGFAKLLQGADLAITAGGYSCFELAAMGIPMIVVPHVAHQVQTATRLRDLGCAECVPCWGPETLQRLRNEVAWVLAHPDRAVSKAQTALALIDGQGRARVVRLISEAVRRPSAEH